MAALREIAHLLGAAALVLPFAMLHQRRIAPLITLYAVQAMVVAAAACWQGVMQAALPLFVVGLVTLAANGIAIPLALQRIVRRGDFVRADGGAGRFAAMVMGVGVVGLSVMVVIPTSLEARAPSQEDLAFALSVVLLGMLMMIVRRNQMAQVIGLLSLDNGIVLAAVGVTGMPLVVMLSVAALILVAAVAAGVVVLPRIPGGIGRYFS